MILRNFCNSSNRSQIILFYFLYHFFIAGLPLVFREIFFKLALYELIRVWGHAFSTEL